MARALGSCSAREHILVVFIISTFFEVGKGEKGKMLLEMAAQVMLKGVV